MDTHPDEAISEVGDDRWQGADLCVCCLAELDDGCATCRSCGAPVLPTVAMMPWEITLAEGFIYRRAIAQPNQFIVVAGLFTVFSQVFLSGLFFVSYDSFFYRIPFGYVLLGYAELIVSAAGIWQCSRNYCRVRRGRAGLE